MPKGLDYWGPFGCMIIVLISMVAMPAIGAWAWIPLTITAIFATVMAIIRRNAQ